MTANREKRRKRRQVVKMHDVFPNVCAKCGSNELVNKKNVREREERVTIHGVDYTHAKRYYAECKGCGQSRAVCERIRRVKPTDSEPTTQGVIDS